MASHRTSSDRSRSTVVAGLLILAAAAGLIWRYGHSEPSTTTVADSTADEAPRYDPSLRAVKPPPVSQDFVGSEACTTCHADVAHRYEHQPMNIAGSLVPGPREVEEYDDPSAEFRAYGGLTYRVERRDDEVYHHEIMKDAKGDVIYDQAVRILLAIGSGTRGRTYAVERGGRLFESPISWYSSGEGKWDLSPGYEVKNKHFERVVSDQCVLCHSGRINPDPKQANHFLEPIVLEAGIGCERCHGPGKQHVARQQSDNPPENDDSIVNPAKLAAEKREAICNQCHLLGKGQILRYGRSVYDFRPGQSLEDVWLVVVEDTGVEEDGRTKAVSQVQQMRASACYRGSNGQMDCNSCHDAHEKPDPENTAAYYRKRCLECHAGQGCSLPEEKRLAPPAEDSCIHCHMPRLAANDIPHASQTDHRVMRIVDHLQPPGGHDELGEPTFYDHADERIPQWEQDRAKALALLEGLTPNTLRASQVAQRVAEVFRATLNVAPDDVRAWEGLGRALMMQQKFAEAQNAMLKGLEIAPDDEELLNYLILVARLSGDVAAAAEYLDRLSAVSPWSSQMFSAKATVLFQLGKVEGAIEAGEKSLEFEPSQPDVRKLLIQAYAHSGNLADSNRHADILRRMQEAIRSP